MARNRKVNRRRRRGRFGALVRLLCTLLVAGAIVAALTLFFKVQTIVVSGSERYQDEEIVAASGVRVDDNLFLLNKYSAAQAIFDTLPYVEETAINRKLPDTIVITVRECTAAAGVETAEGVWLVSGQGKLLERVDAVPEGIPSVAGLTPADMAPSAELREEDETFRVTALLSILHAAREQGMLSGLGRIELADAEAIYMEYLGRFTVKMPWDVDIDLAFRGIRSVVEETETNQTGQIDLMTLMTRGKVHFIPTT